MTSHLAFGRPVALLDVDRRQDETLERARAAHAARRFATALALYEQLGAGGNAAAAEIAGRMLLFGENLYGRHVPQDKPRAAALLARAARAGSVTARHLLRALGARPAAASAGQTNSTSFHGD